MHNGLIKSLLLYPMKYLNELFVSYGSYLENNILLTSMSSILVAFLTYLSPKFMFFPLIFILDKKEK